MKLSADDMREFINQRKPTTPEELKKEALTIKDLEQEFPPEEAEAIRDYVYLKSPTVPDAIKNLANEEEGERLVQSKQKKSVNLQKRVHDMKKDK